MAEAVDHARAEREALLRVYREVKGFLGEGGSFIRGAPLHVAAAILAAVKHADGVLAAAREPAAFLAPPAGAPPRTPPATQRETQERAAAARRETARRPHLVVHEGGREGAAAAAGDEMAELRLRVALAERERDEARAQLAAGEVLVEQLRRALVEAGACQECGGSGASRREWACSVCSATGIRASLSDAAQVAVAQAKEALGGS